MRIRGKILGVIVILLFAFALAACGPASESKVLNIGWTGNPDSLNPGVGLSSDSYDIYNLVYDALYQLQPDGTFTMMTRQPGDGVAPGTYKVLVQLLESYRSGKNAMPERYSDPATTPLEATVDSDHTEFEFTLEK
jgi:ABC-type oligopeptide transport system substrate-binding subunit